MKMFASLVALLFAGVVYAAEPDHTTVVFPEIKGKPEGMVKVWTPLPPTRDHLITEHGVTTLGGKELHSHSFDLDEGDEDPSAPFPGVKSYFQGKWLSSGYKYKAYSICNVHGRTEVEFEWK